MVKKTIEENALVKSAYNKEYAKRRIITQDQREARRAYSKMYNKKIDVKARVSQSCKDARKKISLEEKRNRFLLKGKPIPPRYMNEAELVEHKEADKERRRVAERNRLSNNECRDRKRQLDRERMCNEEARKRKRLIDSVRAKGFGTSGRGRARRYGSYVDKVEPDNVYSRDKWRCVSCSCKGVRSKEYRPDRATVDHRIPLSKGGSHTYENCQTMCVVCNSKKHTKVSMCVQLSVFDIV
jgi:hypothetical protein